MRGHMFDVDLGLGLVGLLTDFGSRLLGQIVFDILCYANSFVLPLLQIVARAICLHLLPLGSLLFEIELGLLFNLLGLYSNPGRRAVLPQYFPEFYQSILRRFQELSKFLGQAFLLEQEIMVDIELMMILPRRVLNFFPEDLLVNPNIKLHQAFPHLKYLLPQDAILLHCYGQLPFVSLQQKGILFLGQLPFFANTAIERVYDIECIFGWSFLPDDILFHLLLDAIGLLLLLFDLMQDLLVLVLQHCYHLPVLLLLLLYQTLVLLYLTTQLHQLVLQTSLIPPIVPIRFICSQMVLCPCYIKLRYLSHQNCSLLISSLLRLRNCNYFCLQPINSTKHLRVTQFQRLQVSSPTVIPQLFNVLLAQVLCSWNQFSCSCSLLMEKRESQRVSASCISERWSAKKGWSIQFKINVL